MKVISLDNIWEKYRIKFVKESGTIWREIWALREINLEIKQGEVLGVIGQNGAGKTTLLKLIAGMLMPDEGKIDVQGKVSTLMELGAGFNREFTGCENIFLNARMYGLDKKEINTKIQEIIGFADLGEFIDAPIKYYSQGMYLRLAFSLAISLDPDILLIDDIIAVGDEASTQRCINKIKDLKAAKKTIILVSHQMGMITQMCNRVIHLNEGKIIDAGPPGKIVPAYLETVGEKEGIKVFEKDKFRAVFNNGRVSLSYDGIPLTNRMGGHAVWFNPRINAWVNSKDLDWKIKAKYGQSFTFEGSQEGLDSLQIWTLSLKNDLLEWKIEFKGKEIKGPHFDFGFVAPYDRWIVTDKENIFSPFIPRLNWQDLGIHDCPSGGVGMLSQQGADNFPGFIFGKGKKAQKIRLFNTGYHDEARVVQYLFDSRPTGFYIRVFSEKESLLKHLDKEKKADIPAKKPYLLKHEKVRIKADAQEKAIKVYYQNKEVTAGCGISASFRKEGVWHDAGSAKWRLSQQEKSIRGEFFWPSFGLRQSWKLSFKEGRIAWEASNDIPEDLKIDNFKLGLLIDETYKTYFCGHQESVFPDEFSRWLDMNLEDEQAECLGVKASGKLPAIVLFNKGGRINVIQNSDKENHCRALQLRLSAREFKEKSLSAEIKLFEDNNFIDKYRKEKRALLPYLLKHEKVRIKADAQEKAIKVYYQNKEVTAGCGISASFRKEGVWHDAGSAKWRLSQQEKSIRGEFFWPSFGLRQSWKLSFKEGRIAWEASNDIPEDLKIDNFKLGLLIDETYKTYFCGHQESVFPDEFSRWLDMNLEDEQAECLGVKASGKLPAIVLFNKGGRINVIQNSDKENHCRALQLRLSAREFKEKSLSAEIKLFEDNNFIDKYRKEKRALLPQTFFSISKKQIRVSIDTEVKKIKIFYKNREITERACLRNNLATSKKSFESGALNWQISQMSKDRVVLNMSSTHFPVVERWDFFCRKDNSLKITVDLKIQKKVAVIDKGLSIELKDNYRAWESSSERGTFTVRDYGDNTGAIRMKESNLSAIRLESDDKNSFPDLTFNFRPSPWNRIVNLYKKKRNNNYNCCIGLYTAKLMPRIRAVFKPGIYNLLEGEIIFGKKTELKNLQKETKKIKLVKPNLKLIFGRGKGRLYWKGKEVTAGLGMHTSFCHSGIWYDSSLAAWEVVSQDRKKVTAAGDWVHLPISQVWKIELAEDNRIVWEIKTKILQKLELKIIQCNLMISALYKEWVVPQASQGVFNESFTAEYDILPFRFWNGPTRELLAQSGQLPKVSFKQSQADKSQQGLLENTDYFYRARLLQYQYINPEQLNVSKTNCFKGVIEIEPKKP